MKKLQKSLLLLVLLTFSGCQLEWRKEFNMDFPVFDMKFLDYFGDGYTYVDTDGDKHKYIKSGYTLGGYDFEGHYVVSYSSSDLVGNFGTFNDDGSFVTNLIATVDTSTSNIIVENVTKTFIDNFVESEMYGTIYTYSASDNSLTGHDDVRYTYDPESGDGTTWGTFTGANGTLTATVTDTSTVPATIVITDIPYLDYFENGKMYDGYKYSSGGTSLCKDGLSYVFTGDVDGMSGTFVRSGGSTSLTTTVDVTSGKVAITIALGFVYGGTCYVYSYETEKFTFADREGEIISAEGDDATYYWALVDGKNVYFTVDDKGFISIVDTSYATLNVNATVEVGSANDASFVVGTVCVGGTDAYASIAGTGTDTDTVTVTGTTADHVNVTGTVTVDGDVTGIVYVFGTTDGVVNVDSQNYIENNLPLVASKQNYTPLSL